MSGGKLKRHLVLTTFKMRRQWSQTMLYFVRRTLRSWFDTIVTLNVAQKSTQHANERFPLPFTFKPRLSFGSACIAVSQALISIFSGSLLFGVCGATAWMALEHIANPVLRVAALIPMVAAFLALLALLMTGISMAFRAVFPWIRP
jgi:hypothetical protein